MSAIAGLLSRIITQVDPHLDADRADRRLRDAKAVIDVPLQGRQGDRTSTCLLLPGHFRSAEPPGKLNLHAVRARVHHLVEGALDRPSEAASLHELLGNILGDEHGDCGADC